MAKYQLKGKHVLVTGATGGIGLILCKQLLQKEICTLIMVDQNKEKLAYFKKELSENSGQADIVTFRADLRSKASMQNLIENLKDCKLDVLINNAGIAPGGSFVYMDWETIESVIDTNYKALVFLCHHLLPQLIESEQAHIVNVASGSGLLAPGGMAAYASSKFGVVGFSEALRAELKLLNIGVSVICPPFVKTNIVVNSHSDKTKNLKEELARVNTLNEMVMKYGLSPESVAKIIIKSIEHNKGLVVIGLMSRLLLAFRFFLPGLTAWLNSKVYKKLISKGILK